MSLELINRLENRDKDGYFKEFIKEIEGFPANPNEKKEVKVEIEKCTQEVWQKGMYDDTNHY